MTVSGSVDPAEELLARMRGGVVKPMDIAGRRDGRASADRIRAVRGRGRVEQRRLYEAV